MNGNMVRRGIKEPGRDNPANNAAAVSRGGFVRLYLRNPVHGTQQLVLPLAPLAQLGCLDGITTQVQEHLGALAETLAGKVTRAACDARAVCKQLPAGRLARVVSEQLDLQNMRVASSTELFLELLHGKAHLVGETTLDHGRGVAARLVQKMYLFWLGCQIVEVALTAHGEIVHTDSFHRCWQGHRASWPVGVGIVEPTLYPDSG